MIAAQRHSGDAARRSPETPRLTHERRGVREDDVRAFPYQGEGDRNVTAMSRRGPCAVRTGFGQDSDAATAGPVAGEGRERPARARPTPRGGPPARLHRHLPTHRIPHQLAGQGEDDWDCPRGTGRQGRRYHAPGAHRGRTSRTHAPTSRRTTAGMLLEHVRLDVREGQETAFEAALLEVRRRALMTRGSRGFVVSQSRRHPTSYVVQVRWETAEELAEADGSTLLGFARAVPRSDTRPWSTSSNARACARPVRVSRPT